MGQDQAKKDCSHLCRLNAYIGPFVLLIVFVALSRWSWRKWPDILVDFGRELYIPWQIQSGKILYRDIAHLFGPLSAYVNASLFYLFGDSYTVIVYANLIIFAVFLGFVYYIVERTCSRIAATLCCSIVMCIFGFSQYVFIGNYNFISPYSHEATHGILLSLIMIYQLWRFMVTALWRHVFAAGVLFGFAYLTKVDILLAALVVLAVFFIMYARTNATKMDIIRALSLIIAGASIPIGGFLFYFCNYLDYDNALKAVNGSWISLVGSGISQNKFYKDAMGFGDILANSTRLILFGLIVFVAIFLLMRFSSQIAFKKPTLVQSAFNILLIFLLASGMAVGLTPYNAGFALPLLTVAAFLFLLRLYLKMSVKNSLEANSIIPMVLWTVFGLVLLLKMGLMSRLYHYGFYLALPATSVLICVCFHYIPHYSNCLLKRSSMFRVLIAIFMIVLAGRFVAVSNVFYKAKTFSVGNSGDTIMTFMPDRDPRGSGVKLAVEWIARHAEADKGLVVLPEGVMINYLTRKENPTPYINLMMPEMLAFGQGAILKAIAEFPQNHLVLVHKDTSEYGVTYFGKEYAYGKSIIDWVKNNYSQCHLIGNVPLQGSGFGIQVLCRNGKSQPIQSGFPKGSL